MGGSNLTEVKYFSPQGLTSIGTGAWRGCKTSISDGFQDLRGQSPDQLDSNSKLTVISTGSWTG